MSSCAFVIVNLGYHYWHIYVVNIIHNDIFALRYPNGEVARDEGTGGS